MTALYISGRMTGCEDWNFPAFLKAAAKLRGAGYIVMNPAENWGGSTEVDRRLCMRHDISQVLMAEGVATLPKWQESRGALLEVDIAKEIGIPVYSVHEWIRRSK